MIIEPWAVWVLVAATLVVVMVYLTLTGDDF